MVIIKPSTIHGKGVFSLDIIKKDTILVCDVLEVSRTNVVKDYIFPFIGNRVCIHIGFGSFLNSSKTPNIKHLSIDPVLKISKFTILKDIELNEELTLRYLS